MIIHNDDKRLGCLIIILAFVFNTVVGGWSVDEILSWFGKDIPVWGNAIIGIFAGEITVPVAIIGKILIWFGI
jgi:hypothetical protein